jgi:hypothetical protein
MVCLGALPVEAALVTFGDQDCLNQSPSCYGANDPTSGATLEGLAPGASTLATSSFSHGFPFAPGVGEFPGTDQIFVGSTQTGFHDGYSVSPRLNGPQVLTLDYSSLVGPGQVLTSLTLGIAADDFQFPVFGQPFTAKVNGVTSTALTSLLNGLSQSGPQVQFVTLGLDPSIDAGSHVLTISIDQGGDGGDGWAVDFLTVGVTTASPNVPEPSTILLLGAGGIGLLWASRRAKR